MKAISAGRKRLIKQAGAGKKKAGRKPSARKLPAYKPVQESFPNAGEKLRILFHNTDEGICCVDASGNCTYVNPAFLKLLGYSESAEILGKNIHEITRHSFAGGTEMSPRDCSIVRTLREGKSTHRENEVFLRTDGIPLPVSYFSYPEIVNGRVHGAIVTFVDNSRHRQAEEQLKESQKRFQGLVETLYDWVWEIDAQGRYTYVSPQVRNILGYEPDELLGKTPFDLMSPAEADRLMHQCGDLIRNRQPIIEFENVNIHKNGSLVILETNGLPFYDTHGNFAGYRGADRDITKRKQAEERLRRNEEALREAQRIAQLGNWEFDFEKNELKWSDSLYELFELDPLECVPSYVAFLDMVHADDRALVDSAHMNSINKVGSSEILCRLLMRDGRIKWINQIFRVERDQQGYPVKLFGIVQDITKRKEAEEALRESSEYLNNLIRYANAPIIVWDAQFRITRFNQAFEKLTGMEAEEVLGKHIEILLPEETRVESLELIRKTVTGEHLDVVEIPIRHKNGNIRILLWNSANIYSAQGNTLISTIAQGQDITERKEAMEKISHMATHDFLTELPTMRLAQDRLLMAINRAHRDKTMLAVMFIDLDGFKQVNDGFGHDVGDRVLKQTASRLVSGLRATNTVARVGGDEFLLIAADLESRANAAVVADKVRCLLSEPMQIEKNRQITITASIGIALYPNDGSEIDVLIKAADDAMYRVKNSGKNDCAFAG